MHNISASWNKRNLSSPNAFSFFALICIVVLYGRYDEALGAGNEMSKNLFMTCTDTINLPTPQKFRQREITKTKKRMTSTENRGSSFVINKGASTIDVLA